MSNYYFDVYSVVTKPVYADMITDVLHYSSPVYSGGLGYTFDNTAGLYTTTNYREFGENMRDNIKFDANGHPIGVKSSTIYGSTYNSNIMVEYCNITVHYSDKGGQHITATYKRHEAQQQGTRSERGTYQYRTTGSYNQYPANGISGNYWYVRGGVANSSPTISGSATEIGSITTDFDIDYIVQDADGDSCTVTITLDSTALVSNQAVTLGRQYTQRINISDLSLSSHTITVTAKDTSGATTNRAYTFTKTNAAPVISGYDEDLGEKSKPFSVKFTVTDSDKNPINVKIDLDGTQLSNQDNAQDIELTASITSEQLKAMEIGSKHTLTIKADDSAGGISYRRYTFIKANIAPIISGADTNLGDLKIAPKVTYCVLDQEGDEIEVKKELIFPNNKIIVLQDWTKVLPEQINQETTVDLGTYKANDTQLWNTLPYVKTKVDSSVDVIPYKLVISARDEKNISNPSQRIYSFGRVSDGLQVIVKLKDTADIQPKKIIAVADGQIKENAILKVEATNNYNDAAPVWEDITELSKKGRAHTFANTTKIAATWFIAVKVTIDNDKATASSVIRGLKGGFE